MNFFHKSMPSAVLLCPCPDSVFERILKNKVD